MITGLNHRPSESHTVLSPTPISRLFHTHFLMECRSPLVRLGSSVLCRALGPSEKKKEEESVCVDEGADTGFLSPRSNGFWDAFQPGVFNPHFIVQSVLQS